MKMNEKVLGPGGVAGALFSSIKKQTIITIVCPSGAPEWIRATGLHIRSVLLYPLSYSRIFIIILYFVFVCKTFSGSFIAFYMGFC